MNPGQLQIIFPEPIKLRPCPKCLEPGGLIFCKTCHAEYLAVSASSGRQGGSSPGA